MGCLALQRFSTLMYGQPDTRRFLPRNTQGRIHTHSKLLTMLDPTPAHPLPGQVPDIEGKVVTDTSLHPSISV